MRSKCILCIGFSAPDQYIFLFCLKIITLLLHFTASLNELTGNIVRKLDFGSLEFIYV